MSWDYNGYLHLGVGFSLEQKPKFSFSNLRLKKVILKILTLSLRIWSDTETQLTQKPSSESEKIIFCSNKFQFCNYEKYFFCWFSLLMSHWPHTVEDIWQGSTGLMFVGDVPFLSRDRWNAWTLTSPVPGQKLSIRTGLSPVLRLCWPLFDGPWLVTVIYVDLESRIH